MGFCIETVPQTGSNEEMERVLASLFMSCPPGTGIQISLYASPHILPSLREQANMLPVDEEPAGSEWESRRNRNIYRVLGRRRIDHYLKGAAKSLFSHHVYLLRDYRCVIAISTPLDPESPADVEEAIRIKESTHATLRSAHMPGWDWGPESLLNFVADFFDHERVLGQPEEQTYRVRQFAHPSQSSVESRNCLRRRRFLHQVSQGGRRRDRDAMLLRAAVPEVFPDGQHGLDDRRLLPDGPLDAVSLPHHHGGHHAGLRVGQKQGADEGGASDAGCRLLHGAFPARPSGSQARLGHGAARLRQRPQRGPDVSPDRACSRESRTPPGPNMPSVPSGARAVSIWPRMSICSIRRLWRRCR